MTYENKKEFRKSWYAISTPQRATSAGPLTTSTTTDVCIVGGGFTGLSAALELAKKNYRVVVLDAGSGMAGDASGRNGGHILRGLAKSPADLSAKFGIDTARAMCDMTLEGIDLIRSRTQEYAIACDLHMGHVTAALTTRHLRELEEEHTAWRTIGRDGMKMLDQRACENYVRGEDYIGGLFDSLSGHFHPYAYAQGLATAAQKHGAVLHDRTHVTDIVTTGPKPIVVTQDGAMITADYVLVAGAIDIPAMQPTLRKSISATAHMIATAPLDENTAAHLMPGNAAVADANFVMNYYRLSNDRRLLFGGNCNYSGHDFGAEHVELKKRLTRVFPALADIAIDHCWHGPLDLTGNRLPAVGRLSPNVFYAHGFGGHGIATTNIMGKLMAEAVIGTAERFDVFERIHHIPFVGGTFTKRPLFMLGMVWYQLRDALRA